VGRSQSATWLLPPKRPAKEIQDQRPAFLLCRGVGRRAAAHELQGRITWSSREAAPMRIEICTGKEMAIVAELEARAHEEMREQLQAQR